MQGVFFYIYQGIRPVSKNRVISNSIKIRRKNSFQEFLKHLLGAFLFFLHCRKKESGILPLSNSPLTSVRRLTRPLADTDRPVYFLFYSRLLKSSTTLHYQSPTAPFSFRLCALTILPTAEQKID